LHFKNSFIGKVVFRLTDLGSASWLSPIGVTNITSSHTKGQRKPGAIFHFAKTANQVTLGTVNAEYV
jgi:hypothetical protein